MVVVGGNYELVNISFVTSFIDKNEWQLSLYHSVCCNYYQSSRLFRFECILSLDRYLLRMLRDAYSMESDSAGA